MPLRTAVMMSHGLLRNGMCIHFGSEECLQRVLGNTVALAHGIIELQICYRPPPVQGLDAIIMVNF